MQEMFGQLTSEGVGLGKRGLEQQTEQAVERQNLNKGGRGKGGRVQQQGRGAGGFSHGSEQQEEASLAEMVRLMSKIVIRQEDTVKIMRQSTGWVLFAKTEAQR